MRFSRQEYWSGAIPSSKGSSWPRDWTHVSCVSCIGRHILYPPGHLAIPYIISVSQPKYPLGLCPSLCLSCLLHPLAAPQRHNQGSLCLGSRGWIPPAAPARSTYQLTGLSVFTVSFPLVSPVAGVPLQKAKAVCVPPFPQCCSGSLFL